MQRPQENVNSLLLLQLGVERRKETRNCTPFPMTVQGVDADGVAFQRHTIVDNIAAGGLCVRLMQALELGSPIYFMVQLSTGQAAGEQELWLSGYGVIRHARPEEGGAFSYGIEFKHRSLVWQ
jgi:hypothetical protein